MSGSENAAEIDRLAQELGNFGFRWLIACAAYPALRLPITLYLGAALKRADGDPPPAEEEVLALAALPWFRQGWMPDDWRQAFLARQSPNDREITRLALLDLAYTTLEAAQADELGRVTVARVRKAPEDFAMTWQSWRGGLPDALADHDPALEALVAPRGLASRRGVIALGTGTALGAIGLAGGLWLRNHVAAPLLAALTPKSSVASLSAIDPSGRFVTLAYPDGAITRARTDGSGGVERTSFGSGAWRALGIGGDAGSTVLALTEDATLIWGTSAGSWRSGDNGVGKVVRAEMSADGQVAVMLTANRSDDSAEWQLAFWGPPDPPRATGVSVPADHTVQIGVGGRNHFAVLADRKSIELLNLQYRDPIPSPPSDDITPFLPADGLTAMAVSNGAALPGRVVGALLTGEILVGTPGGDMDRVNPGLGEIASLTIGERTGIIAPVWAAGGVDGRIAVQGPDRIILAGHTGRIVSLAFAPDFTALASASDDTTVRIWRLVDGASLVMQTGGPLLRVAWVADQDAVVSVNADGRVRIWPVNGWPGSASKAAKGK